MSLLSKITSRLSSSEAESSSSSSKTISGHARRREQVRRAQRTHRERKAEYVKSLEAEVTALRAKDAQNAARVKRYAIINERLTALLAANNILVPPELQSVDDVADQTGIEVLETAGGSQHLRLSYTNSPSNLSGPSIAIDFSNSQTAVDFILALEQPCLKEFYRLPEFPDGEGHSMQLQSSIVDWAPAPNQTSVGSHWPTGSMWKMPTVQLEQQLEKLLETSKRLPLTAELTSVVCWMVIKSNPQNHKITIVKLEKLKGLLAAQVNCYGFGGVIDEQVFYAILNSVIQAP